MDGWMPREGGWRRLVVECAVVVIIVDCGIAEGRTDGANVCPARHNTPRTTRPFFPS